MDPQEGVCREWQLLGCDIGRTAYEKYETGELNIRISVLIALKKIDRCSFDDFSEGPDEAQING